MVKPREARLKLLVSYIEASVAPIAGAVYSVGEYGRNIVLSSLGVSLVFRWSRGSTGHQKAQESPYLVDESKQPCCRNSTTIDKNDQPRCLSYRDVLDPGVLTQELEEAVPWRVLSSLDVSLATLEA